MNSNKIRYRRFRTFIPVTHFSGLQQKAFIPAGSSANPTLTIAKAAGTASTSPLLETDANGARLVNNTIAADRTGITGIIAGAFTGTPVAIDTLIQSAGAGNPLIKNINALGLMGLLCASAGDDIRHTMLIPSDLDRAKPVYFRAHWASAAAAVGARTITWKVMYKALVPGTTALAAPSTVLDTPIAAQAPKGTAYTIERSPAGVLNRGSLLGTNKDALMWSLILEMDAFDAAFVENKYLLGLELEYTPKLSNYSKSGPEAPKWRV